MKCTTKEITDLFQKEVIFGPLCRLDKLQRRVLEVDQQAIRKKCNRASERAKEREKERKRESEGQR